MKVLTKNTKIENFVKIYNKVARPMLVGLSLLALGGLYAGVASAQASNVYITPDGGGNGVCTNNTHPPSWFNNSGNWGNGATQIGPGTIVHLCGTFVGAQGTTMLTAQGSGSSGNPVTILFESGANLTSPAWSGATGAIDISKRSYVVVDGGRTCGWVNNASVPCNGTIQNTNAGSSLGVHPAGFISIGVYAGDNNASGCTPGCRVTNLNIINLYVHVLGSDTNPDQQRINAVTAWPIDGFRADHNIMHDSGWAINAHGNNQEFDHNDIYNVDHGLAAGVATNTTGMLIHDNHFHDFANWDVPTQQGGSAPYHHDGVHIWGNTNINHMIYNNLFDGDIGQNATAWFYEEDSSTGITLFNNVFVISAKGHTSGNGMLAMGGGTDTGVVVINNTFLGLTGEGLAINLNGYTNSTVKNNLVAGTNTFDLFHGGTTLAAADYNQYEAQGAVGGNYAWQAGTIGTNNLPTWQASAGQDGHSHYYSTPSVGTNGILLPSSPAIGAATNLTSLGIVALNNDASGKRRPSSGAWDVGAYSSGTTVAAGPTPPTNLKITVQ